MWDVLRYKGFHYKFIAWIKSCVTIASFSININGTLQGFFKSSRGLGLGDPMSPYLFILGMDILANILKEKAENPNFSYHWRTHKTKTLSIAFADDILLLARGDLQSALNYSPPYLV